MVLIRAGEPEPGVFGALEPEPLEKKQEPVPEPLGKKVRSYFWQFFGSGEKNILPNLTNTQDSEPFFWPLGAGAGTAQKKIPGARAGAAWEKNQEPEPLEKKSQEPEPEPLKNLPAPQP